MYPDQLPERIGLSFPELIPEQEIFVEKIDGTHSKH
jgi:hypothetical protein